MIEYYDKEELELQISNYLRGEKRCVSKFSRSENI